MTAQPTPRRRTTSNGTATPVSRGTTDVPSQESRMWPGERPFTDHGQWGYGYLDLRVFDQDETWVDISGVAWSLPDMSAEYRHNVLKFLHRNATYFHLMTVLRRLVELYADLFEGRQEPSDVQRLRALLAQDPVDWVLSTPIALALLTSD